MSTPQPKVTSSKMEHLVAGVDNQLGDIIKRMEQLMLTFEQQRQSLECTESRSYGCIYCNQQGHRKRDCKLLTQDLHEGKVRIINGSVADLAGNEIQPGRGGIRVKVSLVTIFPSVASGSNSQPILTKRRIPTSDKYITLEQHLSSHK